MAADPRQKELIDTLRNQGLRDERVLTAMERIPREVFVEQAFEHDAYKNSALPIACGQTISQPSVVAIMTMLLELNENMRVLELGTGSGYQAAILSQLCRRVYTIERHKPLLQVAQQRFNALKIHNIVARHGDGFEGWSDQAPFDRILATAAMPEVPESLIEQLKPGGVLIAPVGDAPKSNNPFEIESFSQRLVKIMRSEDGVKRQELIPVMFVPMLPGLPQDKTDDRDKSI